MPYAPIHEGRDYVVTWSYLAQGVSLDDARRDAAIGTRALGLDPSAIYVERDAVRARARGVHEGTPWVPIAVGHMQLCRLEELEPAAAARTGQAAGAAVCVKLEPAAGAYALRHGRRYRALVSVSAHFTAAAIGKYLGDHGWTDVRMYEGADPLPADWPKSGEDTGGLEDGHRWLRGEASRSGPDDSIDVVSTLHQLVSIRLSIYRIADLWECTPAAPASPSTPSGSPATSSPSPRTAPPTSSPASRSSPMVTIYGASWCSACHTAAEWLTAEGIPFVEVDVEKDAAAARELARKLAAAKLADPGVLPILDVAGRLLVGFSPDKVHAAIAAAGAPVTVLRMGPGPGPGGLDGSIPADLARQVEASWALEADPTKLRAFAATLRQAGYPLAGSVLDQQALNVQSGSHELETSAEQEAKERARDRNLKTAALVVGVVGVGVTLASMAKK